tara:strand:- start:669 stop:953 length:285 start_codon:yes stop_codon:yes gene_type:complete
MSKILRIDLQGSWNNRIYDSKEDLRKQLIDLHYVDVESCYGEDYGFTETEQKQKMKEYKKISLDEICSIGDWDYEIISDKQAKEIEEAEIYDYE